MSSTNRSSNPGSQPLRLHLAIQGILLATALTVSVTAHAESSNDNASVKRSYHISSGELGQALRQFATNSGLLFSVEAKLTDGKSSQGLEGDYTVEEGYQKLLTGTGLMYKFTGKNTVTLQVAENQSQSSAGTLPVVKVVGSKDELNDPYNKVYTVRNSSTATKTDTLIFDTPVSLQVVPRAVMDDQNTPRIKDALENVSGVRPLTTMGMGTGFILRGFSTNRVYRNGLVAAPNGWPSEFDTANLESVEVLKGPTAVLFGRAEPGGLINLTTKKPLDTPFYSVQQQFGSYDYYRTQWDATGPINDDKTLLYRFTGSYQNNNSFRDFIYNDRVMVSPSLAWKISDKTDFNLNVEGVQQTFQADLGIPVVGNKPAAVPINYSYGDPNDPPDHFSKVHLGTEFNHKFNEDWAIHNRFLTTQLHLDTTFLTPAPAFGAALQANNQTFNRKIYFQNYDDETYTTNLDLTGKFQLLGMKHESLFGVDFLHSFTTSSQGGDYSKYKASTNSQFPTFPINISDPSASYGIPASVFNSYTAKFYNPAKQYGTSMDEWYGAYFQDQITLLDKVHILGGGRYDWTQTGTASGPSTGQAVDKLSAQTRQDQHFSPRVGILYQPWQWVGVFGSWSNSFGANNGLTTGGSTIAPEIGEQFEAGFKTQLFDKRLTTNLAYFHLTKDNVLTKDLSDPTGLSSVAIGQVRSQGIEFDMTGKITDNLSVIGNFAYTDARVTKDNSGFVGDRLINVPDYSGSTWLKYAFNGYQTLDGLSVSIGGVAVGTREGNLLNPNGFGPSFQLPGYVRLDAMAAYAFFVNKNKVTAQFNIRNLLDKTYYDSADGGLNVAPRNGVYPGAPLMAFGSFKVEF